MRKVLAAALAAVCLAAAVPAHAFQENVVRTFHIGTVTGEAGAPCPYYSAPEAAEANLLGYYPVGAQVLVWSAGPVWCHAALGRESYIPTDRLMVSADVGTLSPIGFAYVTFAADDPAVQSTDNTLFIPFLSDGDAGATSGDPLTPGTALQLIGLCGDMVQARRYATDGFVQKKHVHLLTDSDLFAPSPAVFGAGEYAASLPAGLYRAAAAGGDAEIRVSDGRGKALTYTVSCAVGGPYTLYIPAGATVTVTEHGTLCAVTGKTESLQTVYDGGRILGGVDGNFTLLPGLDFYICAENAQDAYYVLSTPWNDAALEAGIQHALAPGEARYVILMPGESIELHHCRLESREF